MAKRYVTILGIILVVIGVLGFVNPLTPNGNLFGIFAVSTNHDLFYLASGIVALVAVAGGEDYAALYAKVFGVIFGLVTVLGFMVGDGEVFSVINVNQADNVLHLAIAASALYVGFANGGKKARSAAA